MDTHATTTAGPSNASSPARTNSQPHDALTPPIALSKRTSSKNALRDNYHEGKGRRSRSTGSPPSTPPPRVAKREGRNKGKQPAKTHSALAAISQSDRAGFNPRHSHGLSWSSTTRDSVVDNLLFSLDSLPRVDDVGESDLREPDDELERLKTMFSAAPSVPTNRTAQRARGHTHSSSLSSDYDRTTAMPETPSTFASKGRRSNSSSNFPMAHGRKWSGAKPVAPGRASTDTQATARRFMGIHSRNESDMSNGSSVGYGMITGDRIRPGRRSMSMDQLYTEPGRNGPSMLDRGRPVPSVHSSYENAARDAAAPEPGVPSGPRRMQNPTAAGPVYVGQQAAQKSMHTVRRVDTQTDLASVSGSNPAIPLEVRNQASDFVRASSMRGMPNMPPHLADASGRASPMLHQTTSIRGGPSPTYKEKPGFFKRVFGGGGPRSASSSSNRHASLEYGDLAAVPANRGSGLVSAQPRVQQARVPPREANKSEASHPPVSLNKKPSSFFRRRKKSADESAPIPALPLNASLGMGENGAQPSPSISSLRKVMDPFLAEGSVPSSRNNNNNDDRSLSRPVTTESSTAGDSDNLDIFHSGYTPPMGASLGNRDPLSRASSTIRVPPKKSLEQSDSPQGAKMKVRKRKPEGLQATGGGYFAGEADALKVESAADAPPRAAVSPLAENGPAAAGKENERPASRASTGDRIIAISKPTSEETPRGEGEAEAEAGGDDGFVRASTDHHRPDSKKSRKSQRLFLQPTASEEMLSNAKEDLSPVVEGSRDHSASASQNYSPATGPNTAVSETFVSALATPRTPTSEAFHSASSLPLLPSLKVDGHDPRKSVEANGLLLHEPTDNLAPTNLAPTPAADSDAEPRSRARKIYDGNEDDVLASEAASWLGETNALSRATLSAYMALFIFTDQNILLALRTLCSRLLLKGETQQFDRIITAFSGRWVECNPRHGFGAQDVVHTICYSVILLNTDLHLADIGEKMGRGAYVRNTLPTVRRVVLDAAPGVFEEGGVGAGGRMARPNPNASRPTLPWTNSTGSIGAQQQQSPTVASPTTTNLQTPTDRSSIDGERPTLTKRLSLRPDFLRQNSDGGSVGGEAGGPLIGNANLLVSQPWTGTLRAWEVEVETVLKSFYASIRAEPLPLHGAAPPLDFPRTGGGGAGAAGNSSTLTPSTLKRSGSIVSKAPSEAMSFRSKPGFRTMTMGFQNKYGRSSSRPRIYPTSTYGGSSSRTSFDDGGSVWSPVNGGSSASNWSKYSLSGGGGGGGRGWASASMQSLSAMSSSAGAGGGEAGLLPFAKQGFGFAGALSQAIIREEGAAGGGGGGDGTESMASSSIPGDKLLLEEDESLALEGAPWAKEGLVKHKHHLETHGKKAKERHWNDVFAVIGKGRLTLFAFGNSSSSNAKSQSSLGRKAGLSNKHQNSAAGARVVGAGDWTENATQLDSFVLRQTIASTLPPPGYSKQRPHVWALSLPSGAVHLFQVGTEAIAEEFMSCANYWGARLSKEPLVGGVSNVEYGWSSAVVNPALLEARPGTSSPQPAAPTTTNVKGEGGGKRHLHSNSLTSPSHAPPRPSFTSSVRGSFDHQGSSSSSGKRLAGDKVQLADWAPPGQSLMASQLMQVDQLRALRAYVQGVEGELEAHNEVRGGMEVAFSPRHANYAKAMGNWQRKSDYLLREIVKFQTYADSLAAAQVAREAVMQRRREREEQQGSGERDKVEGEVRTVSV